MSHDDDRPDVSGDESTALLPGQNAGSAQEDDIGLKRVSDSLPTTAWLIAIIECCERSAYFGISGPLQNYI